MRIALAAALMLTVAPLLASPATAQVESREMIALQNQVLELRAEVQSLQSQLATGGGARYGGAAIPPPTPYQTAPPAVAGGDQGGLVAQLLDRVSRLEDQSREMHGRIDELQNELRTDTADLKKQIGDLGFQMQQSGAPGGGAAAAAPPATGGTLGTVPQYAGSPALPLLPPVAGAAPTPAAPRTPELAIRAGYAALARGDYPTAESDAREVLARGQGPRSNDAEYLLARSLYAQRNWRAAAVAYDDAYNNARTGAHAQDSLLGLANALVAIGDNSAACGALARLRSQFPTPRADLRRGVTDASSRAGCR